jgi:hypothetical protein
MGQKQELWVNAVLMPNCEVICCGRSIGWLPDGRTMIPRKDMIDDHFIKRAKDYQLVPRRASVNKKA